MGESLNSSRPFYKQALLLSYFLVTKEEKKSVTTAVAADLLTF